MQADKGRLIIHTGAGPKGIAGEATGKNARRGWQAMKARSEAGRVYFEVRRDGEIIDPAPLMGL